MRDRYDRIVWTAIAVFLGIIALNPWIAPGRLWAGEEIIKVDLVRIDGLRFSGYSLPVRIVK